MSNAAGSETGARPAPEVFLSSTGTGLAIALIYLGLVGGVLDMPGGDALSVPPQMVCLAVMTLLYAALMFQSDRFSALKGEVWLVAGAVLMAVAVGGVKVLSLAGASPVISYAAAAIYGMGIVLFRFAGVGDFSYAKRENVVATAFMTIAAAGVGVLLGSLLDDSARFALVLGILVAEMPLFFFSGAIAPKGGMPDRACSKDRLRLGFGMSISYGLMGVILIFSLMWAAPLVGTSPTLAVLGGSILASVAAGLGFVLMKKQSELLMSPVYYVTFLPLMVLVLLFPFTEGVLRGACFAAVLVVLFLRDLARILNRLVIAAEVNSERVYLYARTSLPLVAGLFLGGVLYLTVVRWLDLDEHAISVILALLLCAASVVCPYGTDEQSMPILPPRDEGTEAHHAGYWRLACEGVADEAGLTPRELDVALLLSRGRTADVIARNLGISIYTVKTHISNVYRKCQAGSQQSFINMVEDRFEQMKSEACEPKERI